VIGSRGGGFCGLTERCVAKPLIAALNGHALAGGCEIALACDLIVAAETAQLGLPEVRRGLVAAAGGVIRLPRRIPYHAAMEIVLTGQPITARRAHELGLVARVVPRERVLDEARALAAVLLANGPFALRTSKALVRDAMDLTEEQAFERQRSHILEVFTSEDALEGARAFAEKRPPVWKGK
jgi:enoyl-CoA hydratase